MPRIQQLPNSLINQIAAGEVIERPASVVKEIIENAIDAGATQIDIDIEDGGGKLIRVRDNGCGIHPDDLALAFATHATSKIRNLDDLEHITTLGFRGEALPSIASVSKTTLTSRAEGESSAWRISPHLGDAISPAAHPPGTTIEIRDLFYNTPARKKFLKSERTERQHIQQLVQNLALSHDGITIRLNNHGKPLGVYGGEGLAARIASVLGDDLLEQALPIDARAADMHLYGWVGLPTSATNQPERQYFYINGRIIRDKIIAHAIRQAYQDMLYHGRHPVYVLYLDIAPEHIDVNAHPAKHEVRFRESRLTHDFLYSSLHHALRGNTPAAAPRPILLFVHGGGFVRGDKRGAGSPFYDNIMLWAAGSGLLGININYRLAPEHPWPAAQQDIAAALLWAQSHAAEYGGDPQRIILCGHSAGAAHIAQYLAHPTLRLGNDGVRGAILVSGIYDTVAFGDSPARQAYFGSDRAQIAARSAQAGLLQCGVPLLIAAAELDPPEFRQQAERLGVPHYLLAGHSHISEILAVNTGDTTLSGLMQAFAAQHA